MKSYEVLLQCPVWNTYRCKRAADSLDIDVAKKSIHQLKVSLDLDTPFNVGLIVGASGSGKTTLAHQIFGPDCFKSALDPKKPVIEQFPEAYSYDDCSRLLCGIGLTAVPCWIRPVETLSNGQKARAEAALLMAREAADDISVIDEWTSVVDRTVAKVMSHCVQKHARATSRRIVLLSCHYDVIDWLNPDWVVDCNKGEYIERRSLWRDFKRSEQLQFEIRAIGSESWPYFSKYHYLSDKMPGGHVRNYGLFHGVNQIGFLCYANYVPKRRNDGRMIMHANRAVIHPDYAGMSLSIRMLTATAAHMRSLKYRVMTKFSSTPIYRSMIKDKHWKLFEVRRQIGEMQTGKLMKRKSGFRTNIKTFSFEYVGDRLAQDNTLDDSGVELV